MEEDFLDNEVTMNKCPCLNCISDGQLSIPVVKQRRRERYGGNYKIVLVGYLTTEVT